MAEKTGLPNYTWIQTPIGLLDDPDYMRLSSDAVRTYQIAYLLAGRADAGGLIGNGNRVYDAADIAFLAHVGEPEISGSLRELEAAGFVKQDTGGWRIVRFLEEQGPGNNETRAKWTERQRKHRAKIADEELESEPDIEEKREKEQSSVEESRVERHRDVTVTPPAAQHCDSALLEIFKAITGKYAPPATTKADVMRSLGDVMRAKKSREEAIEYLKPFYQAFMDGPAKNKNWVYWLTDWAMVGQIPETVLNPKPKPQKRVLSSPDGETIEVD